MSTKHTSTPWVIGDARTSDSEFIIRACKMHEELVTALMDIHPTIADDSYRAEIGALIAKARRGA